MNRRVRLQTRSKRTEDRVARKELQALKGGVETAVKQLRDAQEDIKEIGSFTFVCIQALRAQRGDDVGPDVATVMDAAYEKLVLDVNRYVRDSLKALGHDP
jgi:hypothetical protein